MTPAVGADLRLGPVGVRHAPVWPLRILVASAGLVLAVALALE